MGWMCAMVSSSTTSAIDKYNLRDEAIKLISDPDQVYTAEEASDILTNMCGNYISDTEYLELRKTWLLDQKRRSLQPVPLLPPSSRFPTLPGNLQELQSFSQIDLFGTLTGIAEQALRVYGKTDGEGDHKGSIQALRLIMDSSEAIDKKLKAMNAKDPMTLLVGNQLLQNMTDCLSEINYEHPEWNLLIVLKEKIEAKRKRQAFEILEDSE
jgi:hypothetical protein